MRAVGLGWWNGRVGAWAGANVVARVVRRTEILNPAYGDALAFSRTKNF